MGTTARTFDLSQLIVDKKWDYIATALIESGYNRLLTQPIPSSGETDDGETAGDEGGAEDAGGSSDTEMEPEEPAEEDPV